jgi:tetratricopeptide (TPR) repeat protein
MKKMLFASLLSLSLVVCSLAAGCLGRASIDKAIADYTNAIEIYPEYANAYYNRGIAWYDKGEYDNAIADYTRALALAAKDAKAYHRRSLAWRKKGDHDKAIRLYTKAIARGELSRQILRLVYVSRGEAWNLKGDYDRAIADYTKAIASGELSQEALSQAYNNRGSAWDHKGDFDKAIADYTKTIEIDPRYAKAYNSLAWLMATCPDNRYRDGTRAVELAGKAAALKDSANVMDTLAAAYAEAGMVPQAIKTQERAIAKLKQEGWTNDRPAYRKHLSSYKAGKRWREK